MQHIEMGLRHLVGVFPPDRVSRCHGFHCELVLWRPAREFACLAQEGPSLTKLPFIPAQGFFDDRWLQQVIIYLAEPRDTLRFKGLVGVYTSNCHPSAPRVAVTVLWQDRACMMGLR